MPSAHVSGTQRWSEVHVGLSGGQPVLATHATQVPAAQTPVEHIAPSGLRLLVQVPSTHVPCKQSLGGVQSPHVGPVPVLVELALDDV